MRITEIESARELDSSRADAGYAIARSLTPHAEAGLARKASADLGTAPAIGHDYVPRVLHIHILQLQLLSGTGCESTPGTSRTNGIPNSAS